MRLKETIMGKLLLSGMKKASKLNLMSRIVRRSGIRETML
tara:strand:- start:103 stop:222 length:120 start_codon:yes stop_codon:yes gene_type:complete